MVSSCLCSGGEETAGQCNFSGSWWAEQLASFEVLTLPVIYVPLVAQTSLKTFAGLKAFLPDLPALGVPD